VSDATAWSYGEALREIAKTNKLHNLTFIRIWDLLDYPLHPSYGITPPAEAKAFYLAHAIYLRRELDYRYGIPNFDVDAAIASDPDIAFTYASYIDFLTKELPEREDGLSVPAEVVAKRMLKRGKAYAAILSHTRPQSVRLSIHNSIGKGKLSIPLVPGAQGEVGLMPWRSAVVVGADGSYRTVYPGEVRETHELVYKFGRPYAFRERSDMWKWKDDGEKVELAWRYPRGVDVKFLGTKSVPLEGSLMSKLKDLVGKFGVVSLKAEQQQIRVEADEGSEMVWRWSRMNTDVRLNGEDSRDPDLD
jgi:hypothetical protein